MTPPSVALLLKSEEDLPQYLFRIFNCNKGMDHLLTSDGGEEVDVVSVGKIAHKVML